MNEMWGLICLDSVKLTLRHCASTSLPSNTNAPIWSMSIEMHGKFLLGRLFLSDSMPMTRFYNLNLLLMGWKMASFLPDVILLKRHSLVTKQPLVNYFKTLWARENGQCLMIQVFAVSSWFPWSYIQRTTLFTPFHPISPHFTPFQPIHPFHHFHPIHPFHHFHPFMEWCGENG